MVAWGDGRVFTQSYFEDVGMAEFVHSHISRTWGGQSFYTVTLSSMAEFVHSRIGGMGDGRVFTQSYGEDVGGWQSFYTVIFRGLGIWRGCIHVCMT